MDITRLEKVLENEPKYRLKQAREAVFKNFISDWLEATFFTKELREKLNKECPLKIEADGSVSKDKNSVKARIILKDGLKIESVLMRHSSPTNFSNGNSNTINKERSGFFPPTLDLPSSSQKLVGDKAGRNTVCVSSQVGCPLGCLFCATGKMGFKRNLTVDEILEQVIFFERYLQTDRSRRPVSLQGVTNVTFMGMGEPFLNYGNVLEAIKILNNKEYFNIGARSISVSTAGIIEGIKKFSEEGLQLNLAISLNATNDKLRSSLMPINKKHSLKEVLKSVDEYIKKTNRKVMFEYVLIKGINDSDECAKELAGLMKKKLYFLNLILYNPTENFKPSETKRVENFKKILKNQGINFVQRYRFGDDIKAACGQFSGELIHR